VTEIIASKIPGKVILGPEGKNWALEE